MQQANSSNSKGGQVWVADPTAMTIDNNSADTPVGQNGSKDSENSDYFREDGFNPFPMFAQPTIGQEKRAFIPQSAMFWGPTEDQEHVLVTNHAPPLKQAHPDVTASWQTEETLRGGNMFKVIPEEIIGKFRDNSEKYLTLRDQIGNQSAIFPLSTKFKAQQAIQRVKVQTPSISKVTNKKYVAESHRYLVLLTPANLLLIQTFVNEQSPDAITLPYFRGPMGMDSEMSLTFFCFQEYAQSHLGIEALAIPTQVAVGHDRAGPAGRFTKFTKYVAWRVITRQEHAKQLRIALQLQGIRLPKQNLWGLRQSPEFVDLGPILKFEVCETVHDLLHFSCPGTKLQNSQGRHFVVLSLLTCKEVSDLGRTLNYLIDQNILAKQTLLAVFVEKGLIAEYFNVYIQVSVTITSNMIADIQKRLSSVAIAAMETVSPGSREIYGVIKSFASQEEEDETTPGLPSLATPTQRPYALPRYTKSSPTASAAASSTTTGMSIAASSTTTGMSVVTIAGGTSAVTSTLTNNSNPTDDQMRLRLVEDEIRLIRMEQQAEAKQQALKMDMFMEEIRKSHMMLATFMNRGFLNDNDSQPLRQLAFQTPSITAANSILPPITVATDSSMVQSVLQLSLEESPVSNGTSGSRTGIFNASTNAGEYTYQQLHPEHLHTTRLPTSTAAIMAQTATLVVSSGNRIMAPSIPMETAGYGQKQCADNMETPEEPDEDEIILGTQTISSSSVHGKQSLGPPAAFVVQRSDRPSTTGIQADHPTTIQLTNSAGDDRVLMLIETDEQSPSPELPKLTGKRRNEATNLPLMDNTTNMEDQDLSLGHQDGIREASRKKAGQKEPEQVINLEETHPDMESDSSGIGTSGYMLRPLKTNVRYDDERPSSQIESTLPPIDPTIEFIVTENEQYVVIHRSLVSVGKGLAGRTGSDAVLPKDQFLGLYPGIHISEAEKRDTEARGGTMDFMMAREGGYIDGNPAHNSTWMLNRINHLNGLCNSSREPLKQNVYFRKIRDKEETEQVGVFLSCSIETKGGIPFPLVADYSGGIGNSACVSFFPDTTYAKLSLLNRNPFPNPGYTMLSLSRISSSGITSSPHDSIPSDITKRLSDAIGSNSGSVFASIDKLLIPWEQFSRLRSVEAILQGITLKIIRNVTCPNTTDRTLGSALVVLLQSLSHKGALQGKTRSPEWMTAAITSLQAETPKYVDTPVFPSTSLLTRAIG